MVKKKYPHEFTDARGNTIIQYEDGSSEMYVGGKDLSERWLDVSNDADKQVNRKRFLPDSTRPPATPIHTRDADLEDEGVPGIDDLDEDDA